VGTASGASAASAQKAFKFENVQQPRELLNDAQIDVLFILTRHDTHAKLVSQALDAGKAIFVEKPLAVDREQLVQVQEAYAAKASAGGSPFVMVGFNRRFAPMTERIRQFFAGRREPMLIHARVNAGYVPPDHWIHAAGGRIVGEFCHFVDWARSVVGSPIRSVAATGLPDGALYRSDNIAVTLTFADRSVANLLYLANGDRSIAKEYFEVFCQGAVARLDDFRVLELARNGKIERLKDRADKGHRKELELTIEAIRTGKPSPIPFDELVEVTETTFQVRRALASGGVLQLTEQEASAPAVELLSEMPMTVSAQATTATDMANA
jgi:polar amino acid transport system substrate-binding protein